MYVKQSIIKWDETLIRSVFSSVDVHRILQIPLHVEVVEDFEACQHTWTGTFSVLSAYHVEFEHQYGHQWNSPDGKGSHHMYDIWKCIWACW